MEFRTYVPIPKSNIDIHHSTKMMLFGSCFSENIGRKLSENKFDVDINPFGILYNPLSISSAMQRLLQNRTFSEADLVFRDGLYHSFSHHGAFSHSHKDYCLKSIRSRFSAAASRIRQTDVFLITFGTAYVYRLQQTGEMVGNCHKFPSEVFDRFRLSVDDIVAEWSELIADLCKLNPSMKIVFTVSPIRHWRDGAHENQVSKSILHLAIDQLMAEFEDNLHYFPAYEIVMDELRDYRFYSEDMFHPSETAIDYLWKRFRESFFSPVTEKIISDWQPIYRSLNHKSLNFETHEYRNFLMQTLAKLEQFKEKYPFISCKKETELLLTLLDLV
jgi:hypothetical protein